jgi:hypothetical protein
MEKFATTLLADSSASETTIRRSEGTSSLKDGGDVSMRIVIWALTIGLLGGVVAEYSTYDSSSKST